MGDDIRRDDIIFRIGDDRPIAWELEDVDGDALDAGSYSAIAQVRPYSGSDVLYHEWSTHNGHARFVAVPVDGAPDRWFVELITSDSRTWTWRAGDYDLYVYDPDGEGQPIAYGFWRNRGAVSSPGYGPNGGAGG